MTRNIIIVSDIEILSDLKFIKRGVCICQNNMLISIAMETVRRKLYWVLRYALNREKHLNF